MFYLLFVCSLIDWKVLLYSHEQKHRSSKIYYNRMKRRNLAEREGGDAGDGYRFFGRPLQDLRISVIDRCNFRCTYCMPAEVFGPDYAFKDEFY